MKCIVLSYLLLYVILLLLYMESCCCIKIDRGPWDVSDSLDVNYNCNSISNAFSERGRCRCGRIYSSIVSTSRGYIACINNKNIDSSKYA